MEDIKTTDSLMESPLMLWLKVLLGEKKKELDYEDLCNGVLLLSVWQQIDSHASVGENTAASSETSIRLQNLNSLLSNIKVFYEEVLGQVVLLPLPDILAIARCTSEESSVKAMNRLLLLVLGCAVQCERKEHFIEIIKTLDIDAQHQMVEYIKQVTDNPEAIWSTGWNLTKDSTHEEQLYLLLEQHVQKLAKERDELSQKLVNVVMEQESQLSDPINSIASVTNQTPLLSSEKSQLVVELADARSRMRKLQQDLEEKTESVTELKEELQDSKDMLNKLKQENFQLIQNTRAAQAYRDQIDILKEKVQKVDRLENEVQKYKDKMAELEFYKTRVEELRENNRILMDTKTMLENQLESSRKRAEQVLELEAEVLKYRSRIYELCEDQESDREKIQQLEEENTMLYLDKKLALDEVSQMHAVLKGQNMEQSPVFENSLHEQLNNDAESRVLQLELENQQLQNLLDDVQSSSHSSVSQEENHVQEIANEKEQLQGELQQLKVTIGELQRSKTKFDETEAEKQEACRNIKKLQHDLLELQKEHQQCEEMKISMTAQSSENQRLHRQLEVQKHKIQEVQEDIENVEAENQHLKQMVDNLRANTHKVQELEREATNLEGDNHKLEQKKKSLEKEVARLKHSIEIKDEQVDEYASKVSSLEREKRQLQKEVENWSQTMARVRELERDNKDLSHQAAIHRNTLNTLREIFFQDLVSEKLKSQQIASGLERQLNYQQNEDVDAACSWSSHEKKKDPMTPNSLAQEIADLKFSMSDLEQKNTSLTEENLNLRSEGSSLKENNYSLHSKVSCLEQQVSSYSKQYSSLQSKHAHLEVEHALLESQKEALTTQVTNLQGQLHKLEEEKDKLLLDTKELQSVHETVCSNNETLQKLHDQLTAEYEKLSNNHSILKASHKSLKSEYIALKGKLQEESFSQEMLKLREMLEGEKDEASGRSFTNLQSRYSELKEQFRTLKENNDQLLVNHAYLETKHKAIKTENNELKLKNTALKGEVGECRDEIATLDVQVAKLVSYCEMLSHVNNTIENDRQSVMTSASVLLSDYHNYLSSLAYDDIRSLSTDTNICQKLWELGQEKKQVERAMTGVHQELEKLAKKAHKVVTSAPQMRRARSEHFPGLSRGRSSFDRSKTRSFNVERLLGGKDILNGHLENNASSVAGDNSSQSIKHNMDVSTDDDIPVRDVGPGAKSPLVVKTEDKVSDKRTDTYKSTNAKSNKQPISQCSSSQTTVENLTTVNLITNLPANLGFKESFPKQDEELESGMFSKKPEQSAGGHFEDCASIPSEKLAQCHTSTPVTKSVSGEPRNSKESGDNIKIHKNHDASKMQKAKGQKEVDKRNFLFGSSKEKKSDSSVWYEYGCI
ncbi:protein Daple-like isoform X1 [Limulus polyphemus]|uniref:Protein Daple-like isoform X1 n=2 Tax=Limulus polyphemus TaxID=6850 RepID=A0ABM1SWR1_LIMPO|nr:protein Daple-like isoform X1 [Limulus polyphemus]XP_022248068.1 protein Daple-like isoform X1 [Limulus polyphemus]XP_022248069.1 protein Daple-like isoform X1 [Limulus polyphemus]XP_022248070.1 protein Daple-like isoform X1 [Limulus polyphemus]XP_022248071.1 protein Daple-like isoform X1 [Limulus polyphemus]